LAKQYAAPGGEVASGGEVNAAATEQGAPSTAPWPVFDFDAREGDASLPAAVAAVGWRRGGGGREVLLLTSDREGAPLAVNTALQARAVHLTSCTP
jgi:hypothetical protein